MHVYKKRRYGYENGKRPITRPENTHKYSETLGLSRFVEEDSDILVNLLQADRAICRIISFGLQITKILCKPDKLGSRLHMPVYIHVTGSRYTATNYEQYPVQTRYSILKC